MLLRSSVRDSGASGASVWRGDALGLLCPCFTRALEREYAKFRLATSMPRLWRHTILSMAFIGFQLTWAYLSLQMYSDHRVGPGAVDKAAHTAAGQEIMMRCGAFVALCCALWAWFLILRPGLLRWHEPVLAIWVLSWVCLQAFAPARVLKLLGVYFSAGSFYGALGWGEVEQGKMQMYDECKHILDIGILCATMTNCSVSSRIGFIVCLLIPLVWLFPALAGKTGEASELTASQDLEVAIKIAILCLSSFVSIRHQDLQDRFVFLALGKTRARSRTGHQDKSSKGRDTVAMHDAWNQVLRELQGSSAVNPTGGIAAATGQLSLCGSDALNVPGMALWEDPGTDSANVPKLLLGNTRGWPTGSSATQAEDLGGTWAHLPAEDRKAVAKVIDNARMDRRREWHSWSFVFERPNGDVRYFQLGAQCAPDGDQVSGYVQDVTEDWLKVQRLEQVVQRLQAASSLAIDGWVAYDVSRHAITDASPEIEDFFGVRALRTLSLVDELVVPEDGDKVHALIANSLRDGKALGLLHMRHLSSGVAFAVSVCVVPMPDDPSSVTIALKQQSSVDAVPRTGGPKSSADSTASSEATEAITASDPSVCGSPIALAGDLYEESHVQATVVHAMMSTIAEEKSDISASRAHTRTDHPSEASLPVGWIVLSAPGAVTGLGLSQRKALLACSGLPADTVALDQSGEWLEFGRQALSTLPVPSNQRFSGSESLRKRTPSLAAIQEDDVGLEDNAKPPVPLSKALNTATIFSTVVVIVDAASRAVESGLPVTIVEATQFLHQVTLCLGELVTGLEKAQVIVVKSETRADRSRLRTKRLVRLLLAEVVGTLLWAAALQPNALPHEDVSAAHDEGLDYILRYNLLTRACGACVRYSGYLVARDFTDEAFRELEQVRQQLTRSVISDKPGVSLLLPAVLCSLAAATRAKHRELKFLHFRFKVAAVFGGPPGATSALGSNELGSNDWGISSLNLFHNAVLVASSGNEALGVDVDAAKLERKLQAAGHGQQTLHLQLERVLTVSEFGYTTAAEFPEQDPSRFCLEGSEDGVSWAVIYNSRSQDAFPQVTARCSETPRLVLMLETGSEAESSCGLEWMAVQRLRELPPPLPSWADDLLARGGPALGDRTRMAL